MASSFASSATSGIIELVARGGEPKFLIHEDFLTSQSKPFQTALSGVWTESTTRTIDLEDWDGETVGRLVEFLYTGNYSYRGPDRNTPKAELEADNVHPSGSVSSVSEVSLVTDHPLASLEDCLDNVLPPPLQETTDVKRLEELKPSEHDYKEIILAHAKIYALAQYKSIDALRMLALRRMHTTLLTLNPVPPDTHISSNIIHGMEYIYQNTDSVSRCEEPLRKLVSVFAAMNIVTLQSCDEFPAMMERGGDLTKDLMGKVCQRLRHNTIFPETCYVSNIRVEYGGSLADRPTRTIAVLGGVDRSISYGANNKYIWLVPEYSASREMACSGFDYVYSTSAQPGKRNLSQGFTKEFRYLDPVRDSQDPNKISEVFLLVSETCTVAEAQAEYGHFDGITKNINLSKWNLETKGLYIAWKFAGIR